MQRDNELEPVVYKQWIIFGCLFPLTSPRRNYQMQEVVSSKDLVVNVCSNINKFFTNINNSLPIYWRCEMQNNVIMPF